MKPEELKNVAAMLRELGLSYGENLDAIDGFAKDLRSVECLWRKGDDTRLVKIGLALIAFPDPTISDILGSLLVSVGVIQAKIKRSSLHIEDVYKTFPAVMKELQTIKQRLVE